MIPPGARWAVLIAGGFGAFLIAGYVLIGIARLRRKRMRRTAG